MVLDLLATGPASAGRLLVVTATAGHRPDTIPATAAAMEALAAPFRLTLRRVDGPAALSTLDLSDLRLVVPARTTVDFHVSEARAAPLALIEEGGGVVGIHAAADAHRGRPGRLLGSGFRSHPPGPRTTIVRFASELPGLASLGGGRSWYAGLGRRPALFGDPAMREHLGRCLAWPAGRGEVRPRRRGARAKVRRPPRSTRPRTATTRQPSTSSPRTVTARSNRFETGQASSGITRSFSPIRGRSVQTERSTWPCSSLEA